MKICLITRFFDFRNAGLGRVSMEILKGLKTRGYDVCPISTEGESLTSYLKYTMFELRNRIPGGYDIYHALTPMESVWVPKQKSIVSFHDLILLTHPERAGAGVGYSMPKLFTAKAYFGWVAKHHASKCKIVVCQSEQTRQEVIEILGVEPERTRVIRLGIRPDLEPRPKPDGVFRVGYLGQLDKRKRIHLLIGAFRESKIDGELVIGGIGADEERLKALTFGDKRIKFLGLVPDDKLVDFYNSLDLFVFPTGIEGWGLPLVESMACGKPAVVLKDAIIPKEIKGRCLVAESLSDLFDNINLVRSKGLDGNYQFAKEHSWDRCVEQYIELYEEVSQSEDISVRSKAYLVE